MKKKIASAKSFPTESLDSLMNRIKEKLPNITELQIEQRIKRNPGYLAQVRARARNGSKAIPPKLIELLSMAYGHILGNAIRGGNEVVLRNTMEPESLADRIQDLKNDKALLAKIINDNQTVIISNLTELLKVQRYVEAQLQAATRRAAERYVNEDKKKAALELDRISSYVAETLGVSLKRGNHVDK